MRYHKGLRTRYSLAALALLTLVAPSLPGQQPGEFPPDRVATYKTVSGGDLQLHVFLPGDWSAADHRGAIVFFFGGGWTGGNPRQFFPHCKRLAERGMVAISAQYRTKGSHGTDPFACIEDGKSAIRWVRAHATEWGIDPKRVAAGGGSAGGHVAASTGTLLHLRNTDEDQSVSSVPGALVLFNPVVDTTVRGYGSAKLGARAVVASPAHHIRAGVPPAIIFHGTADTTVPFENVERFRAEMLKHGNHCELVPYEGKAHGFFNYSRDKEMFEDTMRRAEEFLRRHGYFE